MIYLKITKLILIRPVAWVYKRINRVAFCLASRGLCLLRLTWLDCYCLFSLSAWFVLAESKEGKLSMNLIAFLFII